MEYANSRRFKGCKSLHYPLGLLTVAALLPVEWKIRLIDLNIQRLTEKDWSWAQVVMISAMNSQRTGMLNLIKEAKQKGKSAVAGGPYPTLSSNEVFSAGCDYVVRGEAESSMDILVSALKQNKTRMIIESGIRPDLSQSTIPQYNLMRPKHYGNFMIQTSRGCPFNCEFCNITHLFGRNVRYKTPDQIIAELETLFHLGARGHVLICDDNFIANRSHAIKVLEKLISWNKHRRQPFGFSTQASLNLGQDTELIKLMAAANIHEIFIGIESVDEEVLIRNQKFHNLRGHPLENINNINKNGLSIIGSFIIGSDGEKKGAGERICRFVEQAGIPIAVINRLVGYPHTNLWIRMKNEGRLKTNVPDESSLTQSNIIPSRPETEILEEIRSANNYLYNPSQYLERAYRFNLARRPKIQALAKTQGIKPPYWLPETKKKPIRIRFFRLRTIMILIWRQGIRSDCRLQFWRQFYGMRRKNPSRIVRYIIHCAIGEDFFLFREKVQKEIDSLRSQ